MLLCITSFNLLFSRQQQNRNRTGEIYSKARIAIDTPTVEFIATRNSADNDCRPGNTASLPPSGNSILDQSILVDVTAVGSNNDFQRMSVYACVLGMYLCVCTPEME